MTFAEPEVLLLSDMAWTGPSPPEAPVSIYSTTEKQGWQSSCARALSILCFLQPLPQLKLEPLCTWLVQKCIESCQHTQQVIVLRFERGS